MDLAQGLPEDHLVDRPHHLPRTDLAEVAATLARGAERMAAGELSEVLAPGQALLQLRGFGLAAEQNVTCHRFGHRRSPQLGSLRIVPDRRGWLECREPV